MMRFLLLIICICLLFPVHAKAATKISPRLYKALKKTETLIANKSYQLAEQKLQDMLADVKKQSYGHAIVLRSLSSVYALKGQYQQASDALATCLALNVLPKNQHKQALLNLGQLYMAIDQYAKAIRILEPYLKENPKQAVEINVLVANAYAQLKHYRKSLSYIEKAIAASKKPKEAWYQLNLALFFELKEYVPAADLLNKLIQLHPDKKTYWDQLSSVYQQLKHYKKAVSVKQLAYKKGFLDTEKSLLNLANLLLYIHSPYKAAHLIKNELAHKHIKSNSKNWETLANAWTMAKEFEHAIKALEVASELNPKGSLYQRLGQIHVEQENWKLAIASLKQALNKGGLKNTGVTYLLLGMSYYEIKEIKRAEQSFLKASKYRKNKKAALQWLQYMKVASLNITP